MKIKKTGINLVNDEKNVLNNSLFVFGKFYCQKFQKWGEKSWKTAKRQRKKLPIIVRNSWSQRTNYASTGVVCAAIGRYMCHGVVIVRVLMPYIDFRLIYRSIATLKILWGNIFIILINRIDLFLIHEVFVCASKWQQQQTEVCSVWNVCSIRSVCSHAERKSVRWEKLAFFFSSQVKETHNVANGQWIEIYLQQVLHRPALNVFSFVDRTKWRPP